MLDRPAGLWYAKSMIGRRKGFLEHLAALSAAVAGLFLVNVWSKPAEWTSSSAQPVPKAYLCRGNLFPAEILLSKALDDCRQRWPRPLFDRTVSAIEEVRARHGYGLAFIVGLIESESTFEVGAVSPQGAVGLMQILPATARKVAEDEGISLRGASLFDPEVNIRLGFAYLADLERRYGGIEPALVVYNAGPQALRSLEGGEALRRRTYRRGIRETQARYDRWLKSR